MKFDLNITLGNDAMLNERDLADAIRRVAQSVEQFEIVAGSTIIGAVVRDENGNKVGSWHVE